LELVDQPVLLVDPLGPTAGQFVLKRLRLADAAEGIAVWFLLRLA